MSIDKKFKEQIGAIGESGIQSYYGPTVEQRDRETCNTFRREVIREITHDTYNFFRKVKSYLVT